MRLYWIKLSDRRPVTVKAKSLTDAVYAVIAWRNKPENRPTKAWHITTVRDMGDQSEVIDGRGVTPPQDSRVVAAVEQALRPYRSLARVYEYHEDEYPISPLGTEDA